MNHGLVRDALEKDDTVCTRCKKTAKMLTATRTLAQVGQGQKYHHGGLVASRAEPAEDDRAH